MLFNRNKKMTVVIGEKVTKFRDKWTLANGLMFRIFLAIEQGILV